MTEKGLSKPQVIKEEVTTRTIEALMSNYKDAQQAFLELIDNAVDNREEGSTLTVRIRISKDELTVFNQGGKGLDFEGLKHFFAWGHSEKAGRIGQFGVGGKAAMGYLGRGMEVVCSPKGSDTEYRVSDPEWQSREEGKWKEYETEERRAVTKDGYFRARVTNLKKEVNPIALSTKLADIYRPLLLDASVIFLVNGKKVDPLQIKYVEDNAALAPEEVSIQTRFGDWILLKVGVLEEGQRIKPGMRCYYRGRLIEDEEFFGHPTPALMPQASRLIGEAHLNFVPVTANKSSFNRGSAQWENSSKRIYGALVPWMEKLSQLKTEHRAPVENFEKELAKNAKRVLEHVFATTGLVTKSQLPGESSGRRPGVRGEVVEPTPPPSGKPGGPGPKEGRTAPHLTATIGEMKRWGALFSWEVASIGEGSRRSEVVDENGRKVLKINSDHSWYQAEKKAGEAALELYMAETAILKIAEVISRGKSIEEYSDLVHNLTRECGAIYQSRIRESKPSKK